MEYRGLTTVPVRRAKRKNPSCKSTINDPKWHKHANINTRLARVQLTTKKSTPQLIRMPKQSREHA